jgi:PAS domain S-box-containing protein
MADAEGEQGEVRVFDDMEMPLLVQAVLDYGIFMLDPGGHVVTWNAGAERIKGYTAAEIAGRHFSVFYPPEDVAADKPGRELRAAIAEGRLEDEGWRLRKDGSRFWANVVITALFDESGELVGFGKVTRDMTERRAAERELGERRRLLAHLVEAQELERRRIAWDVHDDSIQSMVAVGMRLQLLADRLPGEHAPAAAELATTVDEAIARLRALTFRLGPPSLAERGLADALDDYLREVAAAWGLTHAFRYDLSAEPPGETSVTVFRVCQEALTNVHKHARATRVEVVLSRSGGGLLARVMDDGVGPPADLGPSPDHFGLIEMRERVGTAGGWWTIGPGPGRGTTVEFWVPLPSAPRGAR